LHFHSDRLNNPEDRGHNKNIEKLCLNPIMVIVYKALSSGTTTKKPLRSQNMLERL